MGLNEKRQGYGPATTGLAPAKLGDSDMNSFDEIERDASNPRTTKDWAVVTDDPCPGWVKVSGPALKCSAPTSAMDLNEQDYTDRHRDARRIARVPQLERIAMAAKELADAVDFWEQEGFTAQAAINMGSALAVFREATQ